MSIWDTYPNYTENELRTLVAVTAQVLLEAQPEKGTFSDDLLETSPRAAAGKLLPLFQPVSPGIERSHIQQLLEDSNLSQQICLQILGEVRNYPELAQQVADFYEHETRMMDGGISLLLVGGLVILAMNLKEIHYVDTKDDKGKSKKEFKISFRESGEAVKSFITQLLKSAGLGI